MLIYEPNKIRNQSIKSIRQNISKKPIHLWHEYDGLVKESLELLLNLHTLMHE